MKFKNYLKYTYAVKELKNGTANFNLIQEKAH
jgi:hypothetical protein